MTAATVASSAGKKDSIASSLSVISTGVPNTMQQHIPLTRRNVEMLAEVQDHLSAGQRPTGLHETEMPCRDIGIASKVELAQAPALAPLPQLYSDRLNGHERKTTSTAATIPLPERYVRFGIIAVPPSAAQGLEQGGCIGIPVGLCLDEIDDRLLIGLLGIESCQVTDGAEFL